MGPAFVARAAAWRYRPTLVALPELQTDVSMEPMWLPGGLKDWADWLAGKK